ncbi:MAG TPA: 2-C-methyl-D-erythritol 4-phosphate cytidylyltransferase [Marmoricola sp.]
MGIVPVSDRGPLPFALVHGESLVASASFALEHAGVALVDFNVPWQEVRDSGRPVVLHDPLCPLAPPEFLAEAVSTCLDTDEVVVGVRPVTDTLKRVEEGTVGATVDRDAHVVVCSPVVLPAGVVTALPEPPDTGDFALLVARLREEFDVRLLEAPALARRVHDEADLAVLESLSESGAEGARGP